jgi:Lrp/AsnC family leucine-responsive transcriptional regulator
MIDETDLKILTIIQSAARTSNAEIARRIGLTPSAILERIRKLEENGVIQGYFARVAPGALKLGLLAFIFVRTDDQRGLIEASALACFPEVLELHDIAGEDCFLMKVRVENTEALGRFLRERLGTIPAVRSTRTTIVLETVKETTDLPLPAVERAKLLGG